jgi:NAD(P)-dependent dehydrogenase (short-subunit alcohol dehydrogenase family)
MVELIPPADALEPVAIAAAVRNCMDLTGRTAVVIGGTSGIGRAIAIGLAAHGATVVPAGRRRNLAEEVCDEIRAAGGSALQLAADVRDKQSIVDLHDAVQERCGGTDILVNAAGYTLHRATVEITDDEWSGLMDTNLTGALRACQAFHPSLKASGRGRVINIASLGSFLAFHHVAAYCAAKSALVSLTRSLACEWAPDGISVNAIAPGVFPTELNRPIVSGTARGQEILIRTPMGRFGKPEELVGIAVLLASDGASFLTGQCIAVDGGYLASGVNS